MTVELPTSDSRRYSRLGKYEVLAHISSGGMGAVYKAVDVDLGREVALKILAPELASKPALMERFQREARHIAKLRHRNIVKMYEFGEAAGTYFLALEFVEGLDLYDYISSKGQLGVEEALQILIQAGQALDHLHQQRMVHRDIKPSNFLLTREQDELLVKLTDLGLARVVDEEIFRVTRDGSTVGTIDYMSPEQARDSGAADIRSDLYSLGCTLYHMLAGRPPFAEGGLAERLYKHLHEEPPNIRQFNPEVTPLLVQVLQRLLAKDPRQRYPTPALLLRDLTPLTPPSPAVGGEGKGFFPSPSTDGEGRVFPSPPTHPGEGRVRGAAPRTQPWPRPHSSSSLPGRETPHEVPRTAADASVLVSVTPEQRQAAAGQFDRAKEVISAGNLEYGIHLLLTCCKLDPGNLGYRRVLRRAERAQEKQRGWRLPFLSRSPGKSKLKAAKAAGEHLKVLELGEEVLVRDPWDKTTQMMMAEAAEALGLLDLAVWILKHASSKETPDLALSRTLARLYEKTGRFREAIELWEQIRQADPNDLEASRKSRDLAAADTIARGKYKAEAARRQAVDSDVV